MIGMHATTGKHLAGTDHLRQSVLDILNTPKRSRVLVRDYGSDLYKYLDNPHDSGVQVAIIAESAGALARWEKRLLVKTVNIGTISPTHVLLTIVGINTETGDAITLEGIAVDRAKYN